MCNQDELFDSIIRTRDVLIEITSNLIKYSKTHDMELPYEIRPLLEQAYKYMHELKYPTGVNNECSVCNKLNPDNADYCCYCGSSLIISHISPDLLQPKNKDSNHPKSYRTKLAQHLYMVDSN